MVHYKLIYFNGRGLAEPSRYIFAAAGQDYEDFRFERDEWPKHKPNTPLGQAPVLEITDGSHTSQIAQSLAIARYLANEFGLAGKNNIEKVSVNKIKYK
jgi:glutathione S-transferase